MFEFFGICWAANNLLSKKVKYVWADDCQLAFDKAVKLLLHKSPVLKSPDHKKPFNFKLMIDSSDVGTGAVLVQEASDELDHPISFFHIHCKNIKHDIVKISKKLFSGGKRNIGLSVSLRSF